MIHDSPAGDIALLERISKPKTDYRIDSQKLIYHPRRVADWLEAGTWDKAKTVYPLYVEISPVGGCPHRCTFCGVMHILEQNARNIPQLDGGLLRERLREMGSLGVKSVMFAGEGEPLLHKETNASVCTAKASGLSVAFTTNGVLLNKLEALDLCSWVKVSVNAGSAETYAKIHRAKIGDWDRVWANIESAAKRKGTCQLSVQCVVLPENEDETADLYDRAADVGVDLVILKAYSQARNEHGKQYANYRQSPSLPMRERPGTKLVKRDDTPSHEKQSYDRCHATPHFWAYVMATGEVKTCSAYLDDDRFSVGNINTQTFREIWEGEVRRRNWEMMKTHDISECRKNCRMHRANLYLDELAKGVPFQDFV